MYFSRLELRDFRNFTEQRLMLSERLNLFVGDNGQGKTNILEAIALVANGRSFRTTEASELICRGAKDAQLAGVVHGRAGIDERRVIISDAGKELWRNEKKARWGEGAGCIVFAPEETRLLKDFPEARRRYLDRVITRFNPTHGKMVREFERTLAQRNRLLADGVLTNHEKSRQLPPWDDRLIHVGTKIVFERAQWSKQINSELAQHYATLAGCADKATFHHIPFCGEENITDDRRVAVAFTTLLAARREEELVRRVSLVGPQRDDFVVALCGANAKRFASQGEHRSLVLALKLTECALGQRALGEVLPFLLDDVGSELDAPRRRRLFASLVDAPGQVFVTATESSALAEAVPGATFKVFAGQATAL